MHVQSYLFFEGRCEEAINFYRDALGAEVVMLMRYKDSPEKPADETCAPASEDNVMHASFKVGDTLVMASDGMGSGNPTFSGISLALTVPDDATAKKHFEALQEGGQVHAPLMPTFFSSSFGMVADKFGVSWMIMAEMPQA